MNEDIRKKYRFDRSVFDAYRMSEHGNIDNQYWKNKTVEERLAAAAITIELAFGIKDYWEGKVDRTVFSSRKHSH